MIAVALVWIAVAFVVALVVGAGIRRADEEQAKQVEPVYVPSEWVA